MARKKQTKATKHTPTAAEVANDGSLRWFPYRKWEALWSDTHSGWVRFVRYDDEGKVELATLNGMSPLVGAVSPFSVRRLQPGAPGTV